MIPKQPLSAWIVAKAVHITQAVEDIVAIRPHTGESQIADGFRSQFSAGGKSTCTTMPSLIFTTPRGFEDSILVFCRNRHDRSAVQFLLHPSADREPHRFA